MIKVITHHMTLPSPPLLLLFIVVAILALLARLITHLLVPVMFLLNPLALFVLIIHPMAGQKVLTLSSINQTANARV